MNDAQVNEKGKVPYWVKLTIIFFFGWIALYGSRAIVGPLMVNIGAEFDLSKAQLGSIMSIFFIGYTALNIPSGMIGDYLGKKKVLVTGVVLFGGFTIIAGMMPTYVTFMFAWVMVGIFQGFYYGPQYGLSSEAIPKHRITLGSAIINSGMAFGLSIGYYISSISVGEMGMSWRAPFYIIGVPIIIIGLVMLWIIKDKPKAQPAAENGAPKQKVKLTFKDLFGNRNINLAYVTIFCSIYGFFVLVTWLPYYLETERGITGTQISTIASLMPWFAIPGSLIFSWVSDKIGRRKPVLLIMLPLSLVAILAVPMSESMPVLIGALILYGIVGKISTNPVLVAVVADNSPRHALGTSFGVYNCIGMLGSVFAPTLTGFLSDKTGSMDSGFYFAAILICIGIVASLFIKESNNNNEEAKA
ncbi:MULTISPECIES: MFS transporter [Proteus]|uniref:MFS transporter n=1 Tax=Proteus appendicitidis TaxID=3034648 RepID=A0ABY8Y5W0_9GAMM|nr:MULTISPECIES: MFS transporter [Proteus]MBG2711725.1 MFS transporter [Proteus mirabilis]MBG2768590.1 MFS transporter [Proteus mirabilis]MBG6027999.1 MFS transporter [Proteus mirabilis]MBG6048617.1 MFS transporter [Proteus mirabilis]MBI6217941.1 MFS transporter [Proteus vulgaris]